MLTHSQSTKQHIVLRADSEAFADQIDILSDVVTVDDGSARCGWKQAS